MDCPTSQTPPWGASTAPVMSPRQSQKQRGGGLGQETQASWHPGPGGSEEAVAGRAEEVLPLTDWVGAHRANL